MWVLLDVAAGDLPEFRNIYLYGVLEIPYDNEDIDEYELIARSIHILGGRLIVGWPDEQVHRVL